MTCASCAHVNPPGSRFCNQCGHRLSGTPRPAEPRRAAAETEPAAFAVPGSAVGGRVPLERALFPSAAAATAALRVVGAQPEPALQVRVALSGRGKVVRCFGVLLNPLDDEEATDAGTQLDVLAFDPRDLARLQSALSAVGGRVRRVLARPDNERVAGRMREGRLKHLPTNQVLSRRIEQDLGAVGLHLPWATARFDVAFGRRCREVLRPFGAVCYFGHLGRFVAGEGGVYFARKQSISVPFGVDGAHTWEPPISDEVVDPDCVVLVEATARA